MKTEIFISQAFIHSQKSEATRETYSHWIQKLCNHAGKPHPLDITIDDIQAFYLYYEAYYSLPSMEIIRAAIKYFYTVLCRSEAPDVYRCEESLSGEVEKLFSGRRRHACKLPEIARHEDMQMFLSLLPDTNSGRVLREMYATGKPLEKILGGWKMSKGHLQHVAAKTARKAGVYHGFGLRGIRASGIVERIRRRRNDNHLKEIMDDAGIGCQQFSKYLKIAGLIDKGESPGAS